MDRQNLQTFIRAAEDDLSSIRGSLLLIAQTSTAADISVPRSNLARLRAGAAEFGYHSVVELVSACDAALTLLPIAGLATPQTAYSILDKVASIEAELLKIPLRADDFLNDVSGFVDASFSELAPQAMNSQTDDMETEEFEIDEETFDIFRSEADELLANISNGLELLTASASDENALWEVRRNAHTFKGAAGIVGLKQASTIAHQMEDLLDKLVEMRREAAPQVLDFLNCSAARLSSIVTAKNVDDNVRELEQKYAEVMNWLKSETRPSVTNSVDVRTTATNDKAADLAAAAGSDSVKTTTTPIVRVSLDRLDELLAISRALILNHATLAERSAGLAAGLDTINSRTKLETLLNVQRTLAAQIQEKLLDIRMVKFGTLQTRLSRTVNVTCLDEHKKAVVEIENGEVEIDTLIIDALIEPMLHLLKNAVVHGIESPETRRLLGKSERGTIRIRLETDHEVLVLRISDDGRGISIPNLKAKAISNGLIDREAALSMPDIEAIDLIFDRGLTTADKIDLNAGRGVGMSIVKESVESRGGKVAVTTEPLRGTTFTITMPLVIASVEPVAKANSIETPEIFTSPASSHSEEPPNNRHETAMPDRSIRPAYLVPDRSEPVIPPAPSLPEDPAPEPKREEVSSLPPAPLPWSPVFSRPEPVARIVDSPSTAPPLTGELKPLILIVDDSGIIRRITTQVVEASGFRAMTANNGSDALQLLRSGECTPDLILSDVEMPEMNGWEFLKDLKADGSLSDIPVAMVTSLNSNDHRDRAYMLGAFDFIVKPVNRENLGDVVERCGLKASA